MREALEQELTDRGLELADFRWVVQRLLSNQVIFRDPMNARETEAYDLFARIEGAVVEYLDLMGVAVRHERNARYVIAYPPGANFPGRSSDPEEDPVLQRRTTKEETGLLLVCRKLYEDELRAGRITEADEALVSLETINTTYQALVKEHLPTQGQRRERAFNRLKRLRVVRIEDMDITDEDTVVAIRSTVLALSFQGYLDALEEVIKTDLGTAETEMPAAGEHDDADE